MSKIMKSNIILNHPDGEVTLEELQYDVTEAKRRYDENEWTFTAKTVQTLIDKIKELSQ